MTAAESRRLDLYNGLSDLIGPDRADTLMAYLPSRAGAELATNEGLHDLESRLSKGINDVESRLSTRIDRLEDRMDSGFAALNARIDRMNLTLAAGMLGVIAALIAQSFI